MFQSFKILHTQKHRQLFFFLTSNKFLLQRELLHGHENEHEGSKKIYELLTRKAKRIVKLKNRGTSML